MRSTMSMVRNSSIELLRIASIFLIVTMHVCAFIDYERASSLNVLMVGGVNSIGNVGVSCFVIISGYFGVKFRLHKFLYLFCSTTLYTIIVTYFRFGVEFVPMIKAAFIVPSYGLWFIVCYLILMLLSPSLNTIADRLNKEEFRNMMIILIQVSQVPNLPVLIDKFRRND